jgi:hypothetical protein
MAAWQMPALRHPATVKWMRKSHENQPIGRFQTEDQRRRWLAALYQMEMYFRRHGCSEFMYDEKLDVFCFAEDGRFAFCDEFADWELLRERGYLTF